MASFRKRHNKWQARIQRKGFPDITKSFNQFSVASQWARKIEYGKNALWILVA